MFFLDGTPASSLHRERNQYRTLLAMDRQDKFYKDAFHDLIIHGRKDAVNPQQQGTKACAVYSISPRTRPAGRLSFPSLPNRSARPPSRCVGRDLRGSHQRSQRILLPPRPRLGQRAGAHPTPGVCRHVLGQAVLSLRRRKLAEGRSRHAAASRGAQAGPQSHVAPSLQRGRDLHARQVGVSLVRCLGSGVSCRRDCARRS